MKDNETVVCERCSDEVLQLDECCDCAQHVCSLCIEYVSPEGYNYCGDCYDADMEDNEG